MKILFNNMESSKHKCFSITEGFKSFDLRDDDKLTCLGYEYNIGLNIHDSIKNPNKYKFGCNPYPNRIHLGKNGFHFCKKLHNTFIYRNIGIYAHVQLPYYIETNETDSKDIICTKYLIINKLCQGPYTSNSYVYSFNNGRLHSFNGLPAVIYPNDKLEYYKEGKLHRDDDQPAIIGPNGELEYYQNGYLHRDDDKPAFVNSKLSKWYFHGILHREGDKPAKIWSNGTVEYFQNGEFHRDNNLPAVITNTGEQRWYIRGMYNRNNDLPTVITPNSIEYWKSEGNSQYLHRENNLPAVINLLNNKVIGIYYYIKHKLHRDLGPAIICQTFIAYYKDGLLHNLDGPAEIMFEYCDESINRIEYYIEGKLHNTNDPAIISSNGYIQYYKNGKYISREMNRKDIYKQLVQNLNVFGENGSYKDIKIIQDNLRDIQFSIKES